MRFRWRGTPRSIWWRLLPIPIPLCAGCWTTASCFTSPAKKEKESKRGQKSTEQKEVRFRPNIGTHDLDAKVRKVREFINDGSKVKLTVRFRGREAAHQQLGLSVLRRVADELKDEVRLERAPAMEGRSLSMVLIPSVQKGEERAAQRASSARNQPNRSRQWYIRRNPAG